MPHVINRDYKLMSLSLLISRSSINILKLFNPHVIMSKKDVLIIYNKKSNDKRKIENNLRIYRRCREKISMCIFNEINTKINFSKILLDIDLNIIWLDH